MITTQNHEQSISHDNESKDRTQQKQNESSAKQHENILRDNKMQEENLIGFQV